MSLTKKNKQLALHLLISLFLIASWFFFTFVQIIINDESVTLIKENFYKEELQKISSEPLVKGDTRSFEITASQNNLGSISIQFNTYNRFNFDILVFRIKEVGNSDWYYEAKYNTRAFTSLSRYPFGFPIIEDSRLKSYIIELESLNGTKLSSVSIAPDDHILTLHYQFDKQRILNEPPYLVNFLLNKTKNSIYNFYLLFTSFVFLFPFAFYVPWVFYKYKITSKNFLSNSIIVFMLTSVCIDIIFITQFFDLVFIYITLAWLSFMRITEQKSINSYQIALILMCSAPIFILLNQPIISEKIFVWSFLALTVGVIINVYELKKHKKIPTKK